MILLKVSGLCWQTRIRFFNPPPTSVVLISINSRIHVLRRVLIFVSIIMLDKIDQLLVILENLIDWVDWLFLTTCTFRFSKNLEINFGVWSHGKKKTFLQLYIYDGDFELKTSWKTALSKNLFKLCFLPLNFLFVRVPHLKVVRKEMAFICISLTTLFILHGPRLWLEPLCMRVCQVGSLAWRIDTLNTFWTSHGVPSGRDQM